MECAASLGEPTNNDPLVVSELRSRARDVIVANHGRGRRTLLRPPLGIHSNYEHMYR